MLRYFFGVGDDTDSLHNEPTIDYNRTLSSVASRRRSDASSFPQGANYNHRHHSPGGRHQAVIDYSDNELDSDEEVNRDLNALMDSFTRTSENLSRYSVDDWGGVQHRLPSDYPGTFQEAVPTSGHGGHQPPNLSSVRPYSQNRQQNSRFEDEALSKPRREGSEPSQSAYIRKEQDPSLFTQKINSQIEELQHQVDKELRQPGRGEADDASVKKTLAKINMQNEFLAQLNDLVDLSMTPSEQQNIPHNLVGKYQALKDEYLKELHNSQDLYKGYYKLILRYRQLRKNQREKYSGVGGDTGKNSSRQGTTPSPSAFAVREKVRLIKSTTTQESIRLICANILKELDKTENQDSVIESYRRELDVAKARIQELELQLHERPAVTHDTATQP